MQDTAKVPRKPDGDRPARRPLIDEQLADQLLGKAQAEGVATPDASSSPAAGEADSPRHPVQWILPDLSQLWTT
jgi:hypothetical protein